MTDEHPHPPDGTVVRVKGTMPGAPAGQTAIVHQRHPRTGQAGRPRGANGPGLVWLETKVIWSHGTADGYWATRAEYDLIPDEAPTDAELDDDDDFTAWEDAEGIGVILGGGNLHDNASFEVVNSWSIDAGAVVAERLPGCSSACCPPDDYGHSCMDHSTDGANGDCPWGPTARRRFSQVLARSGYLEWAWPCDRRDAHGRHDTGQREPGTFRWCPGVKAHPLTMAGRDLLDVVAKL